jgi:hypothetical protein
MDHINRLQMLPYNNLVRLVTENINKRATMGASFVDFTIGPHLKLETALEEIKKEHPYLKITDRGTNILSQREFRGSWEEISSKTDEPVQTTPLPQLLEQLSFTNRTPPPPPSVPNRTDISENMITFGKYNGKSYDFVKQSDVSYCNWILKQMSVSGRMLHFQHWLKTNSRKVTCECCNGTGLVDAV